jgi:hypothetical protein
VTPVVDGMQQAPVGGAEHVVFAHEVFGPRNTP